VSDLQRDLVARFHWVDGHADLWPLFYDPTISRRLVVALADPFRDAGVMKVAGIEARGFILGGAVAYELSAGFVAVRKAAGLFPGAKLMRITPPDYRGTETLLRLQRSSVSPGDRILLVDDWCETASQATTAKTLIEDAGGEFVGVSVIVDQATPDARARLSRFSALLSHESLPPGD
jgi:adenine phosphoribosyltransferase